MKNQGGKIFLILGILLCSGFFIAQKCQAAAAGEVVINEIAWMGSIKDNVKNSYDEWIELKNLSDENIDFTGWIIEYGLATSTTTIKLDSGTNKIITKGGYFLLEKSNSKGNLTELADLPSYHGGSLDNNNGGFLELKDSEGKLIDAVYCLSGWENGSSVSYATMSRDNNGLWCSSANPGGTPKAANDCVGGSSAPETPESPPAESGGSSAPVYRYGDVLINEFSSNPGAGENEWVELYNPSGGEISLDGWTIADGSAAETILSGGFSEDNYYFFVLEKPKGALNNDGDEIILYSDKRNLIDRVVYGKYGEQPANNAPAPDKGESTALKIDGQKSLFDKDGFAVSAAPTKGKPNIISAPENSGDSAPAAASAATAGDIAITEIFPNPRGGDREGEFIELYNPSDKETDLTGWRIEIEGGKIFEFGKFFNPTRTLAAGGYFALYRPESNLILNNNGGKIRLVAPGKSKAAQLLEYGPAAEGLSFADTEKIDLKNAASSTKIFLRNSLMLNRWVWSETPTPGRANQIKTANHQPQADFSAPDKIITGAPMIFDASDSFDEDGDGLSFAWDFGDGARLSLETPAHVFLKPGNYKIKLTAGDGENFSTVEKNIKVSGFDFSPKEKAANKTAIILPENPANEAAENKIAGITAGDYGPAKISGVKAPRKKNSPAAPAADKKTSPPLVSAAAVSPASGQIAPQASISRLKLGAAWKISGAVVVLPGTFGVQYFYILPAAGTPAAKIYNYYKDFPKLEIGDLIEVSGVIGGSAADKYLKTKNAANIKILGKAGAPEPEKITAAGFKEENLGKFAQVQGEVEGKNGQSIFLNDGRGKFELYLKEGAGIDGKKIKAGQKITAAGLLSKVSGALAILPRGEADLIIATSSENAESGQILGAATGSPEWTLPARENNSKPLIYMLVAAGGIIIVLAGWLAKKYISK
jgi:hypothetical protein